MHRSLLVTTGLLVASLFISACDSSDVDMPPTVTGPAVAQVDVAEKYGENAPWITWQQAYSTYDANGNRVHGRQYLYNDDGSTRVVNLDTVWYDNEGRFQRKHLWVRNVSEGDAAPRLTLVSTTTKDAGDEWDVVLTTTPEGDPVSRNRYRYEENSSRTAEVVRERWQDGAWKMSSRRTVLERDAAGEVLLQRTEEWVDGEWQVDTFYDQMERDEAGRVIRAYEDGTRPVTFTYNDAGAVVRKTKKRSRTIEDRWQYRHTDVPVPKAGPLMPSAASQTVHR